MSRDPVDEDGGVHIYQFCRNSPIDCRDRLGLVIHTECPIDDYLAQHLSSWTEQTVNSINYTAGQAASQGALADLILERMTKSSFTFTPKKDGGEENNLRAHVLRRINVVQAALASNYQGTECLLATTAAYAAAGANPVERNADWVWIPGDWAYIRNQTWYQSQGAAYAVNGAVDPLYAGEHIVHIDVTQFGYGVPEDRWWGHSGGSQIKTSAGWFSEIVSWVASNGSPGLPVWHPTVRYPREGLIISP